MIWHDKNLRTDRKLCHGTMARIARDGAECQGFCRSIKPPPPATSRLVLSHLHENRQEFFPRGFLRFRFALLRRYDKMQIIDRNTQEISELNVPPAALFGDDLNQAYFDNLYARIASHMENKMNWLYNQLAKN